jgi:predicted nucleic acid-binding protein
VEVIVDTGALSAMADGDPGIEAFLTPAQELSVPVVALGEFRYGIKRSRHRRRYEAWLTEFLASCRVLRVDQGTVTPYADVREELKTSGRPIPSNDVWIAALARQHDLALLTRDKHFEHVPKLRRVGW